MEIDETEGTFRQWLSAPLAVYPDKVLPVIRQRIL